MDGLDDLEQAVAIAVAKPTRSRAFARTATSRRSLADLGELERAWATQAEALRLGERFGVADWLLWIKAERCWQLYFQGRWDEALGLLDDFIAEFAESGFWMETPLHTLRGRIRLARGDAARGTGGRRTRRRAGGGGKGPPDPVAGARIRREGVRRHGP